VIEHGADVVDAVLQRRGLEGAVGEPRPALVHDDHATDAREATEEVRQCRVLPRQLDVGDPSEQ